MKKKELLRGFSRDIDIGIGMPITVRKFDIKNLMKKKEETIEYFKKYSGGKSIMKAKKQIPVCPKCGSKEIRARIKTGELWCRRCGHVGKREEFFKEVTK